MLFRPTIVKGLLCLFVCMCNGAPPKKGGQGPKIGVSYTPEEDYFIIAQLERLLPVYHRPYGKELWDKMAENHNDMRIANADGFSQERNSNSLRLRFKDVLKYNHSHTTVKVPAVLLEQIYQQSSTRSQPGGRQWNVFTTQENDFVIKELTKASRTSTSLRSVSTARKLCEEHDKKRNAKKAGFDTKRSLSSMRSHVTVLQRKGKLPPEVMEKLSTHHGGASGTASTAAQPGKAHSQGTNKAPDDDDDVDDDDYDDDDDWVNDVLPDLQDSND